MAENKYMDLVDDEEQGEESKDFTVIVNKGAPPWIVTFADLTTLMLTFFVLLLSFANMDIIKFRDLMGAMSEAFGVTKKSKGQYQLVDTPGSLMDETGTGPEIIVHVDKELQEKNMLADAISDVALKTGMEDSIQVFYGEDGLSLRISDEVAFPSGSATLKKEIVPFLEGIAKVMKSFHFNLVVEGHTDNVPIRTRQFPSNWELSTVRATTVLRQLLAFDVPKDRVAAVGYADRKPVRENNTPENRAVNRRVEFKFTKKGT